MQAEVHIIVEGLVQGVGFRWFVQRRAEALGLAGHVRNLYDGSVEILACGERDLLNELIRVVRVGPGAARVTDLKIDWLPISGETRKGEPTSFEIR